MRRLALLFTLAVIPLRAQAPAPPPGDVQPLSAVISQVTSALKEYQDNRGAGAANELPPLSSAEFDFKTTTATTQGLSINLFIFKFGTSHERDVTNDITYTYALPTPKKGSALEGSHPPPSLKDELAQTIQSAAKSVKGSATAAAVRVNDFETHASGVY